MKNNIPTPLPGIIFFALLIPLHFLLRELRYHHQFIMHQYWPFSIFLPKLPTAIDIVTLLAIVLMGIALWRSFQTKTSIVLKLIIVWFICIGTNLFQGVDEGFVRPISGISEDDYGYWQDAGYIQNPQEYLRHYVLLQPTMGYHSRVHPPLAVFLFYGLRYVFQEPWIASLLLSFISLIGPYFLYLWLRLRADECVSSFLAVLFGIAPAFQIYSISGIDTVIAGVFLMTIYWFDRSITSPLIQKYRIIAALSLVLASLLTFGAVWLIPIVLVMSFVIHKTFVPSLKILVVSLIILMGLAMVSGYSYLASFLVAKSFEGTHNFFTSGLAFFSYIVSRIQDILEPILFLGPWILVLLIKTTHTFIVMASKKVSIYSLHTMYTSKPVYFYTMVGLAGLLSFLGFIATGAYYTGETARAAMYIIPPLFASLAPMMEFHSKNRLFFKRLFMFVLGQSILMQLFGWYGW